jgi:predicted ribosomally synthesized peptide with nif11-like leader
MEFIMSPVEAFYTRLSQDEVFRTKVQHANSKEECSQIVKSAGYFFTQDELDAYNTQLLGASIDQAQLQELGEKEIAEVLGGYRWRYLPLYGLPLPDELFF